MKAATRAAARALRWGGLLAISWVLLPGQALAQNEKLEAAVVEINKLIGAGQNLKAARLADKTGRTQQAAAASFELQFLTGVAWHGVAGDSAQPAATREQAFTAAQAAYQRASSLRPESVATLNNLAALNAAAGRDTDARSYYERAVTQATESRDQNLEAYAVNYARYLENRDGPEAIRQAVIAVKAQGSGRESRELLATLYARHAPENLLPFARALLDEGHTAQMWTLGIAGAVNGGLAEDVRRDWLNLLALCTAREALGEVAYDPKRTWVALDSIGTDDPIAKGAQQLTAAISDPPGEGRELDWWLNPGLSKRTGTSSRAAMRELLTALGQRYVQLAPPDPARAARYFRTAIAFGEQGPDPEAFLSLVDLYAEAKRVAELRDLMGRYGDELFSEKGRAYSRGDWPLIYRLHVALGMAYAHLGVWESPVHYQNALFQLTAAQNAARQLNTRARQAGQPEKYTLPPAAVRKLAEGYEAVGKRDLSTKTRIDSAEALQSLGRTRDSAELLMTVKTEDLPGATPETKAKYERLRATLPPQ